jgi:exonuclease III
MDIMSMQYTILSWNMRGMNNAVRQEEIKQLMTIYSPDLVCLQETKLSVINLSVVRNALGSLYANSFVYLPTDRTKGGILIAAKDSTLQLHNPSFSNHSASVVVSDLRSNVQWTFTGVYGPQGDLEKKMFLKKLKHLKHMALPLWLIMGDFNLIYKGQDKNNTRVNRGLMNRFRKTLNNLKVKEIQLIGKRYTWCNRQVNPTMSRIDRAFCSTAWEDQFSNPIVQPLSSLVSDHNTLLLTPLTSPVFTPRFKFEAYWHDRAGFQDYVKEAWTRLVPSELNPMSVLHIKLSRTTKALKSWSRKIVSQGKMAMAVCREVIAHLDIAQERRTLSPEERGLVKSLKLRLLGLAAIENPEPDRGQELPG